MKCFYHNDNDGHASGHVLNLFLYENPIRVCFHDKSKPEFIEMNYDKPFPFDIIVPEEVVYIVDYSIQPVEMDRLLSITKNVHWIDHHKTAIEKYKDYDKEIKGFRYDGLSGCVLTWIYLKFGLTHPNPRRYMPFIPEYIRLIGDYDTWTFEYGDRSLYFYYGLLSENTDPTAPLWDTLMYKSSVESLVSKGKNISEYRDQFYATQIKLYGYETEFEGYNCIVLNAGTVGSMAFNSVKDKYDIMISIIWNGITWLISFYSTKVDVSIIAKKYGGGGHKGASGCQTDKLPFKTKLKS
jgi:uncharacterized protein